MTRLRKPPPSLLLTYLTLSSSIVHIADATLEEPTLVGVKQCTAMPPVRLPLYWSGEYSPDKLDHHGPKDISTIIGREIKATIVAGKAETEATVEKGEAEHKDEVTMKDEEGKSDGTNTTAQVIKDNKIESQETSKKEDDKDAGKRRRQQNQLLLRRHLGPSSKFGELASDGTLRTSISDVSHGSRVVVVAFYYADLHQCSVLAKDLSAFIGEVNAEYIADSLHDQEYDLRANPPISAVAINHMWPLQCDELEEKCDGVHDGALEEEEWQEKLTTAAPKVPLLQDIADEQAWDNQFGAYYTDIIVYLDGRLYKYLPSALAIAHSKTLASAHNDIAEAHALLSNEEKFKATLIEALNYPGTWCVDDAVSESKTDSKHAGVDQEPGQSNMQQSATWYVHTPLTNYVDEESPYHDVVLGFIIAVIVLAGIMIGCMMWKCCCSFCEYVCCPPHKVRWFGITHDGRGEFRPLATADDDDEDSNAVYADEDPDRYEYGMADGDDEDYDPLKRISDPNKAAEEFFMRQEAAEREMTSVYYHENVDEEDEHELPSLDLEMIERKIVQSMENRKFL